MFHAGMKRFAAAAMAVVMAVGLVPAIAFADGTSFMAGASSWENPYDPYEVAFDASLGEDAAAKGVTFDRQTCTLTLDNVKLEGSFWSAICVSGAVGKKYTLTVELVGKSSIVNSNKSGSFIAAGGRGDKPSVVFSGKGSLVVKGGAGVENRAGSVSFESGTCSFTGAGVEGAVIAPEGKVSVARSARLSCVASGKGAWAVQAKKMANSHKSLGTVKGKMPAGAEINNGQAVYQVTKLDDSVHGASVAGRMVYYGNNMVTLKKWVSGTSLNLTGTLGVSIGGFKYRVGKVASGAFANKAGAKLRKLTLKPLVPLKVEKGAFKGTKGLSDLYLVPDDDYSPLLMGWSYYQAGNSNPNALHTIACDHPAQNRRAPGYSGAFLAGAGKGGGKNLTVHVGAHRKLYNTKDKKWYCVGMLRTYSTFSAQPKGYSYREESAGVCIRNYLSAKYGLSKKAKVSISSSAFKIDRVKTKYLHHWGYKA